MGLNVNPVNLTGSNFTHYKNRFSMPGNTDNYHYSWDVGPAHIISFNTEVYFFLWYGLELVPIQYSWLEKELQVGVIAVGQSTVEPL